MNYTLTFDNIDKSRRLLGLEEDATLDQIKSAYRKMSAKYHPDRCGDKDKKICEKKFREITKAYNILMEYCFIHKFSFKKERVEEILPREKYNKEMERFYKDWWF